MKLLAMAKLNAYSLYQNCLLKIALCFIILGHLPSMKKFTAIAVSSEQDNGNGKIGGLDADFIKYLRKSFSDKISLNSSRDRLEEQNSGPFQEPPVMDKPGLFFPDDINPWTSWSSCVDGIQTRSRGTLDMAKLMKCGHLECLQSRSCQSSTTFARFQWATWNKWSSCTSINGGNAIRSRVRQCINQSVRSNESANSEPSPVLTSSSCPGLASERSVCESQFEFHEGSQWRNWSPWSKCERGNQFRTRSCMGSAQCIGAKYETHTCSNNNKSGVDRTWGQSDPCLNLNPFSDRNCRGSLLSNHRSRKS